MAPEERPEQLRPSPCSPSIRVSNGRHWRPSADGATLRAMRMLLDDLVAFFQEHRRCGALEGGVDDGRVWMTCECGAKMTQSLDRRVLDRDERKPTGGAYV